MKIKLYWTYLLDAAMGMHGPSKIYDVIMGVLLLCLGGFAILFGHYQQAITYLFNLLIVLTGLMYMLIALDIIKTVKYKAMIEYFSLCLLLLNFVLSLAGKSSRTDSWAFAVFIILVLILKLRAEGRDGANH